MSFLKKETEKKNELVARPVDDVDLEGALSGVPRLVVGHVGHVVGAPLEGYVRLEAAQIDNLHLLTALVVEDRLVPSYHGRAVAGSEPNVTLKSHPPCQEYFCLALWSLLRVSLIFSEIQYLLLETIPFYIP